MVLLKEKVVMNNNLNKDLPVDITVKNEIPIINVEKIIAQLEKGSMPKELMLFRGGENIKLW